MKLGFMTFIEPGWTLEQHVAAAKRHGYTGIEPRAEANHKHGIELEAPDAALTEARRMAEGEGLEFCCVATSRTYAVADEAARRESVEKTKRYVELAAKVGAPCVRVFGGSLPPSPGLLGVVQYMADGLREVGEFAADYPVAVCVETHDSWLSTYRMMELIRRVDHPSVQVNYDYAHPLREFEPAYESYMHLRPWIKHTHMHDMTFDAKGGLVFAPPFTGIVPQREVMRLLKSDGYRGYFSVEVMNQDPEPTLAAYSREFKKLLAEI